MVKIILGVKKNVFRKGMKAKDIPERNIDIYYIITTDSLNFILSTYEKVEEDGDRILEINGEYYKPNTYENPKYYSDIPNAIKGYLTLRQKQPDRDITNVLDLYKYLEELKKESERLYGLHKNVKLG